MTLNPCMLSIPSQMPATAFKDTASMDSSAINSSRHGEAAQEIRSFLDALNQISDRRNCSRPESKPSKNTRTISGNLDSESQITAASSNATGSGTACWETATMVSSGDAAPCFNPYAALKMTHSLFFGFSSEKLDADSRITATQSDVPESGTVNGAIVTTVPSEDAFQRLKPSPTFRVPRSQFFGFSTDADISAYNREQLPSTDDSGPTQSNDPAVLLLFEGQGILMDWLTGLVQGEQVKADISPDANNLSFFQNLAAQAAHNKNYTANMGLHAPVSGMGHWIASMQARMGLLNMHAIDSTILRFDPEGGGFEGHKPAAADAIEAIKRALLKMAAHHQDKDHNLSKNNNMAVAGKESHISRWTHANPPLENISDPRLQGHLKNGRAQKFQAAVKTGEQAATSQLTADATMVKPPKDISGMKSPNLKSQMSLSDALGHKIIRVEGDSKDSGLLQAQDQMTERMLKLENTTRSSESGQRSYTTQAMNQIVQKAVLSFHNGQNQVQIHLKPEFLGHIRMQIITENQQISIKIMAELPFVRDMLESNLNQLKADLQAQGLKIDELAVSVSHDANSNDTKQAAAEASKPRTLNGNRDTDDDISEDSNPSQADAAGRITESAIDYFA